MKSISYIYSNLDRNNKYLLVMMGIIIFLLILIVIVNHFSKKKSRALNVVKDNIDKDSFDEDIDLTPSVKIIKGNKIVKNTNMDNTNKSLESKKIEIAPVTPLVEVKETEEVIEDIIESDEVIEVIEEDNLTDIDRILLEMEKSESQPELNLTEFEREQEENAIISYDELCKKAGVKKIIYKTKKENSFKDTPNEDTKKVAYNSNYKPSKVISPIYGYQNERTQETAFSNFKKNDNEQDNNDMEFLGNLKQFRNTI